MQTPDMSTLSRGFPSGSLRGYSPVQLLYLMRMQSLVSKKQQYAGRIENGDWRMRLLDKALYSTYCDCVALSIADEARALLRQMNPAAKAS